MTIFGKTKNLEAELEGYFNYIQQSGLHFSEGLKEFLRNDHDLFEKRLLEVVRVEKNADELRREIKHKLYSNMLIPDARGDVLGLLENADNILDQIKKVLTNFAIEHPQIPEKLKRDSNLIGDFTSTIVSELVQGINAFLMNMDTVNDHINKVYFYEEEVDKVEERLKREIFSGAFDLQLAEKNQLRYFAEKASLISDITEGVCERLVVYAIKRSI